MSKHTHCYKRAKDKILYFCTLPGCYHKQRKEFLIGKLQSCPYCKRDFRLTSDDLKRARPKCAACKSSLKGADITKALAFLSTIKLEEHNETRDISTDTREHDSISLFDKSTYDASEVSDMQDDIPGSE